MINPSLVAVLGLAFMQLSPPQTSTPPLNGFRYRRSVGVSGPGRSCAVLDAPVLSHAAPSLKDLRLRSSIGEIPYVITLSEPDEVTSEAATLVQVHSRPLGLVFDLEMPLRPYTDVVLDLRRQNFLATASVYGMDDFAARHRTFLGSFILFDLSSRHLSRRTVLALQESTFRYLHVELSGRGLLPESIQGAEVPPSREAQTLYTTVAASSTLLRRGSETVATFQVPARVPVELVSVELLPGFVGNFDRAVRVTAKSNSPGEPAETSVEAISGHISRVHLGKIQSQELTLPAAMGANLQQSATFEVAVEDGRENPLPIAAVRLAMRRRSICFDSPPGPIDLFYGSAGANSPNRMPQSLPTATPGEALLGPEVADPAFHAPQDKRPLLERRPDILWFLVLVGMGAAGLHLLHTLRRR